MIQHRPVPRDAALAEQALPFLWTLWRSLVENAGLELYFFAMGRHMEAEASLSTEDLMARISQFKEWQYRFELAPGVLTQNTDQHHEWNLLRRKLIFATLDSALMGRSYGQFSFLDCACNAGLWSFELYKRGARCIEAFDNRPENIAKCELVRQARSLDERAIQFRVESLYNMGQAFEPKDIVLALGFFYHLSNPIGVARQLFKVTRHMALIDSNVTLQPGISLTYCAENPDLEHNGKEQSVMVPNKPALISILRDAGFRQIQEVIPPGWMHPIYKEGRRVLLVAHKCAGPSLSDPCF